MVKGMPWQALIDLIEPHDPKTSKKGGRPPLATMLLIHLLQQWKSLKDPAMDETLIEVQSMCRFAGIGLISDHIPDKTTILIFRHLLEKHNLGKQVIETVKANLDATLIVAPSSTKAGEPGGEPEMNRRGAAPCVCRRLAWG
jgi:IS5 family transposase